jgi:hypothetical protein
VRRAITPLKQNARMAAGPATQFDFYTFVFLLVHTGAVSFFVFKMFRIWIGMDGK